MRVKKFLKRTIIVMALASASVQPTAVYASMQEPSAAVKEDVGEINYGIGFETYTVYAGKEELHTVKKVSGSISLKTSDADMGKKKFQEKMFVYKEYMLLFFEIFRALYNKVRDIIERRSLKDKDNSL